MSFDLYHFNLPKRSVSNNALTKVSKYELKKKLLKFGTLIFFLYF